MIPKTAGIANTKYRGTLESLKDGILSLISVLKTVKVIIQ